MDGCGKKPPPAGPGRAPSPPKLPSDQDVMKQLAVQRQLYQLTLLENLVALLSRQSDAKLRQALTHERPEVRWAAAWVVGNRLKPYQEDLINLLTDPDGNVRQAARRGLVLLANKAVIRRAIHFGYPLPPERLTDFGPAPTDDEEERGLAATRWQFWWLDRQTDSPGQLRNESAQPTP